MGLGNPGPQYAHTRHNVGFRIAEVLGGRWELPLLEGRWSSRVGIGRVAGLTTAIVQPLTSMNRSGEALDSFLEDHSSIDLAQNLLVAYDDLDLPFGQIRLRAHGGSGGHRGMESLIRIVGSGSFPRLRFGIGRPAPGEQSVRDFVLAPFEAPEVAALSQALERAGDALECCLIDGIEVAMDRFNAGG